MPRAAWCRDEIYDFFDRWRRTCLIGNGSLFQPDGPEVWSEEHLGILQTTLGQELLDGGSFFEKLRVQLSPHPPLVRQLGLEIAYVQYLGERDTGAPTKRSNLDSLTDLLPQGVTMPDDLRVILDGGIANYGPGKAYRDAYVRFLLKLARRAKTAVEELDDPWRFRDVVAAVRTSTDGLEANAVLHGCFPDTFDVMISSRHRAKLLQMFEEAPAVAAVHEEERKLQAVRGLLSEAMPIPIAEAYDERIRPIWEQGPSAAWREITQRALVHLAEHPQSEEHESDAVVPVNTDVLEALQDVLGPEAELGSWEHVLLQLSARVVAAGGEVGSLAQASDALAAAVAQLEPALNPVAEKSAMAPTVALPVVQVALANELLVTQSWLQEMVDVLAERRQVIFYGPPGTGKTFLARRIARHLCADSADVRIVQFHPSYTYEDFIEGYRPRVEKGTMTYTLVPGPLLELSQRAAAAPQRPHVLVIDEINRGNMAKIFGELYYLLEYRDEPLRLQYSNDKEFRLPSNLYLLGTMNTADRSIALIDAALRRRFSFVQLTPDAPPIEGLLERWLERHGLDPVPSVLLDTLNAMLLAKDGDPDLAIGPSYFMDGTGRSPDLEAIWRYDLLPLIAERFHASGIDVEQAFGLAAVQSEAARRADAVSGPSVT